MISPDDRNVDTLIRDNQGRPRWRGLVAGMACLLTTTELLAQALPTNDTTLRRIWQIGMNESQVMDLAQVLSDSIGPRLLGSTGLQSSQAWAVQTYGRWGIPARTEPYGTWLGWHRGATHIDLVSPHLRTLAAVPVAFSNGTAGTVEGVVLTLPMVQDSAAFAAWLPHVRGAFVAIESPRLSCRSDRDFETSGTAGSLERRRREQAAADSIFDAARLLPTGLHGRALDPWPLYAALSRAGALGVLRSQADPQAGILRSERAVLFTSVVGTTLAPVLNVSCEDYGLLVRLAERRQSPRLRASVEAQQTGEVATSNTIAKISGSVRSGEYIVLSAHLDSWDGASGATDNAAGTAVVMEAMRILKANYPHPRRTILAGHWVAEEFGTQGSRAWAEDHPEVVRGLHALFDLDSGTGRVTGVSAMGLMGAGENLARWFSRVPTELSEGILFEFPGLPATGGRDVASFTCYGAPAFPFAGAGWSYGSTQHSTVDTFDKLVPEEMRHNAVLLAMLVYLADQDDTGTSRDRRAILSSPRFPSPRQWPNCADAPARRKAPPS